jgi:hippurate hydrolase
MSVQQQLLADATALLPDVVAVRRAIHQEPEIGNDLPLTKQKVMDALKGIDLDYVFSEETSGIVATMNADKNGPTILLRGDMDALPMPEDTGVDYASKFDGRMHACGHDAHTAMLVGAVKLLDKHRDKLPGAVKFMFQPGEEGYQGAKVMLDEGVIEKGRDPDAVFGLHVAPNRKSGTIMCKPGPILAAADTFSIKIIGAGGHGSRPHLSNDPVPVACQLVQSMQTFVTRNINAFDPVVLTVGRIAAGTVNNVIPEFAEIEATLRSFSPQSRERCHQGITQLAENIADAYDMTADVGLKLGYPTTINNAEFSKFVEHSVVNLLGEDGFSEMSAPLMAAEDFSYVLQRYNGAFAVIGCAPEGVELDCAHNCHSNCMMIDENAMAIGVATHAAIAYDFLTSHG